MSDLTAALVFGAGYLAYDLTCWWWLHVRRWKR